MNKLKKFFRWLMLWDIIWSPAIAFTAFVIVGSFIQGMFMTDEGSAAGFYDPSIFQAGVYAVGMMVLFSGSALVGMWVNAKGLWKYLYQGKWRADFATLTPGQRFFIAMFPYWTYIVVMIIIWKALL